MLLTILHMRISLTGLIVFFFTTAWTQENHAMRIFAHNDYVRPQPFYTAYQLGAGYIEADVFLIGDKLLVAHHRDETVDGRTLETLYLEPLSTVIKKNHGSVFSDGQRHLTVMIDMKTEGSSTVDRLVAMLKGYPDLLACPTLHFMISGNVPAPTEWKDYPSFILIDGRPAIPYTAEQLQRVAMISTNFRDHVKWDGRGELARDALEKIKALVDQVHAKGKKIRFWATPDTENSWRQQLDLKFDVIVTDDVTGLAAFLAAQR